MSRFAWFLMLGLMAGPASADLAGDALVQINQQRGAAGCQPLKMQSQLLAAAMGHASAMAAQNFFGHTSKNGEKFNQRIRAQGYDGGKTAENIAAGYGSANEVLKSWMGSSGHRRNIMTCAFTQTGLAVVYQADDQPIMGNAAALNYYWVQTFGRP